MTSRRDTSSARLARCCPADIGQVGTPGRLRLAAPFGDRRRRPSPRSQATSSPSVRAARTSMPETSAASAALVSATTTWRTPARRAATTAGSTPRTDRS